jgi:tRNA(adenine34) deaminase
MSDDPLSGGPLGDEEWMRVALAEADLAARAGDVPVGAVLVAASGRELSRGRNRRELNADPTAHAELEALREACKKQGHWRLERTTLYVTLEPCPMCAGALVNARVGRVVFGAADAKAGALVSRYRLGTDGLLNHQLTVEGDVLPEDARDRLQRFFRTLRAEGQK